MRFRSVVAVCGVALLVQVVSSCSVYDPALLGNDPDSSGRPSQVPARPQMTPLPDVADTPTFALRQVVLNQPGGAWREIGVDLDNINTAAGGQGRCEPFTDEVAVPADGENGIDNLFGQIFYGLIAVQLDQFGVEPETAARAAHDVGDGTILAHIEGWNGTANDEAVKVVIAQAVDGTALPANQVYMDESIHQLRLVSNDTLAPAPSWDGTDNWWVRDDGFLGGDPTEPVQIDNNAYIADHVLVVRLVDRPIIFRMGDYAVEVVLRDSWVLATVSDDFQSASNIVVAGRWETFDLLATAEGVGLCQGDPTRDLLNDFAEQNADLVGNQSEDDTNKTCDAFSLGVLFQEGVRGNWSPAADNIVPGVPVPNHCLGGDGGV